MINSVILMGRLTADPNFSQTQNGTAYCRFTVAVNRNFADEATKRIRTKMRHLEERGKNYNVSSAAGARELACFVWGMMNGKIA